MGVSCWVKLTRFLTLTGALLAAPSFAEIQGAERFELEDGRELVLEVGTLGVAENRNKATSREIEVAYLRAPYEGSGSTLPTFILPGGPGSSYSQKLEGTGRGQRITVELIDFYRQRGDVVLVDLRGVSRSKPNTVCDGAPNKWLFINSQDDFSNVLADSARACREKLLAEDFDLEGYTVLEAAADVIAIADSLGYEQFRLHGTSFGSHWAMTVMRYHGERIARAVISGVESYDHTYDDPRGLRAAAELISAMAEKTWQADGRKSDPVKDLDDLISAAQRDPELAHGLEPYLISVLATGGQSFSLTSRARLPKWPEAAADLVDGKVWLEKTFLRFFGARFAVPSGWQAAAVGLFDCSSGLSDERRAQLTTDYDLLFSPGAFSYYDTVCPAWNVPKLPESFRAGEQVEVPVLFVHGDIDFATPLSNAKENLALFPNSHLVVIENGSHSAFLESLRMHEAMPTLVLNWIDGEAPALTRISLPPVEFESID